MNGWLLAAAVGLVGGVAPALWGAATGPVRRRVGAQNTATLLVCLVLMLLAQGYARPGAYLDAALLLALLGPAGTLIYARLFAAELADDPPRGRITGAVSVFAAAAVVTALCAVTPPGRATVKTVLIGALLVAGNLVSAAALRHPPGEADRAGGKEQVRHD
ncbi:monovalent cation/H+ antiporter complex subunit F [Streptomyces sp. NPDC047002]|uniref:monovalent cation/H+ antiporter complex subunit F n=1 Tax=Streptomyces sp. NPDC047002 TaxID=3155475 RepID=UPI0034566037